MSEATPKEPSALDLMGADLDRTMAEFNERFPPQPPGVPRSLEDEFADRLRSAVEWSRLARGPEYPTEGT